MNEMRQKLTELLKTHNNLYKHISEIAVKYGDGTHPKHRLTQYHKFFVDNVGEGESVLDLGSGRGDVTYDVACKTSGKVVGIEININNVNYARATYNRNNLKFIHADFLTSILTNRTADVVILSNVLEHLNDRVEILQNISKICQPSKLLLRVPYFERDWIVAMKKELGVPYFLDRTHKVEYELDEFAQEMEDANMDVVHQRVNWGEIWAVCKPKGGKNG